jgi:site-specific recombinase
MNCIGETTMKKLAAILMLAASVTAAAAEGQMVTLDKTAIGCVDPAVLLDRAAAIQLEAAAEARDEAYRANGMRPWRRQK